MSVINQMLLDLERRGVSLEAEDSGTGVLAVPLPRRRGWGIAGAVALLAVAAAALAATFPSAKVGQPARDAPTPQDTLGPRQVAAPISRAARPEPSDSRATREAVEDPSPTLSELPPAPHPSAGESTAAKPAAVEVAKAKSGPAPGTHPGIAGSQKAPAPDVVSDPAPSPPKESAQRPAQDPGGETRIDKRMKEPTPRQQSEAEFRRTVGLMRQGRIEEAKEGLRSALRLDPAHTTVRQTLAALLVEAGQINEAESVLREGMQLNPVDPRLAMTLARVQVSYGSMEEALATLGQAEAQGAGNADYQAFLGTVLQRLSRHEEAISRYLAALQLSPNSGVWLMGLGISLQAEERLAEAREAFRRARDAEDLSPELLAFVDQRLRALPPAAR
jgi:MSHA biogenesis protein MshN